MVTQLPFGLWMCHKIFHSLSLSLQDFLVGVIIKRVIAQVGAATDFYLCGLNFFSQTPSSEGGGERGYGGGRVDDDKFGENNDGGDGRGSDGEGGSEIMEWDEGDPGGGGDDDDSGGGGGGGGGIVKEVHDYHHHIMSCFGPVCFHCFCLLNHHHSMTEMKRRILKRKSLRSLRSLKNLRSLKSLRILRSLRSLKMIKVETRIQ